MTILEEVIYPVVDEMADLADKPEKFPKSPNTVLLGENASLTSLALVSFIIAVEEKIEIKTGITLVLANEKAMSRKNSPFRTLGSLADYIEEILVDVRNG